VQCAEGIGRGRLPLKGWLRSALNCRIGVLDPSNFGPNSLKSKQGQWRPIAKRVTKWFDKNDLATRIFEDQSMNEKLATLTEMARSVRMSRRESEEQRRSFAYGNTKIENDRITREMVNERAEALKRSDG